MKLLMGLGYALLILLSPLGFADDSAPNPENKFNEILKICTAKKKPFTTCECVVKNLRTKQRNGQFSESQIAAVALAEQGGPEAPEYMADLLAGLEYHCLENSNYSE